MTRGAVPHRPGRRAAAAALLAAAGWAAPAAAQDVPLATPQGFEPGLGLTLGGFEFYTRLQAGLSATSNVRKDPTEESDLETVLAANAVARSTWKRHALAVTASHVDQRALDVDDQERSATSGTISGRIDLWDHWSVNGGVLHQEAIVGKNDPEQFIGNLNGTTVTDTYELGVTREDADSLVKLLSRFQDVENETEIDVTLLRRIQVQDRVEKNLTLQLGPKFAWGTAYILGGGLEIDYDGSAAILPTDRDSRGVRAGVGVEYQQGGLRGVLRVIGFHQEYDTATIGEVDGVVGTGQLTWQIRDDLAVAGKLERSFDEVNIAGSAGLYTNLAAVGLLYQPLDDVYLKAGPGFRFYKIEGLDLSAQSAQFGATAAWQVHDRVELLLNANASRQTVNDPFLNNLEYDDATVTLSTVITF